MRGDHTVVVFVVVALAFLRPAAAQESTAPADRDNRRLFQRFIEDAVVAPGGWLEGQLNYSNLPGSNDLYDLDALIAVAAGPEIEAGLRFGYRKLDASQPPDGSGFSDVDLYGKFVFPGGANRLALGGLLKLPTADENKRLGSGRRDLEVFGAWRGNFQAVTLTANAGVRFNGNPDPPLPSSKDSLLGGVALLLPLTPATTFLIEWSYESERYGGLNSDSRLTPGLQMMFRGGNGGLRGALGLPLSDGAPDWQLIFGAFYTY